MKLFDELTNVELVALDDEGINYYIDLECAQAGIPLLPPRPTAPESPQVEATIQLVKLSSLWTHWYVEPEHGRRIMEAIASGPLFASKGTKPYEYPDPIGPDHHQFPKLESESFIPIDAAITLKIDIERYNREKSDFDTLETEYEKAVRGREDVQSHIYERIGDARHIAQRIEFAQADFARYLTLAQDNVTVAMNFLLKSQTHLRDDEYREAVEELCPGYDFDPEPEPATEDEGDDGDQDENE